MNKEFDEICKACKACSGNKCWNLTDELSKEYEFPEIFPQNYNGIRFTSDAMDCSLPISLDSHSGCSYSCLYCFSNNLMRSPERNPVKLQKIIREKSFYSEWDINRLERFLAGELKDPVSKAMKPLIEVGIPLQLGALGDPFDELERHSGWMRKAMPLFVKYKIPVRISTKGGILLQTKEYLNLFEKNPEQFWFAFSIISNSDELISKIDIKAPPTSERLRAMRLLTNMGCNASLRFRPYIPGLSDCYEGEPEADIKLVERAKESGARAVSFEFIFFTSTPLPRQKEMYRLLMKVMKNPKFLDFWNSVSNSCESCRRGSRKYKYPYVIRVMKKTKELGMTFGISDPHFKEFNDTGSCCGMPEEDKWFGNWSRRQMTNVIVEMRRAYDSGRKLLINYNDWKPDWAHNVSLSALVATGGWHHYRRTKFKTFGDSMREKWNSPNRPRSPYVYFGMVMSPVGVDKLSNDLVYEYVPWNDISFDKEFKGKLI